MGGRIIVQKSIEPNLFKTTQDVLNAFSLVGVFGLGPPQVYATHMLVGEKLGIPFSMLTSYIDSMGWLGTWEMKNYKGVIAVCDCDKVDAVGLNVDADYIRKCEAYDLKLLNIISKVGSKNIPLDKKAGFAIERMALEPMYLDVTEKILERLRVTNKIIL